MGWHLNKLTSGTGVAAEAAWSPCGYVNLADNSENILYFDSNNHLQQLRYSNKQWRQADLTNAFGVPPGGAAPTAAAQFIFANVASSPDNGQVLYVGTRDELIWLTPSQSDGTEEWVSQNILENLDPPVTGQLPVPESNRPYAFLWPQRETVHGVYRGTGGTVHEVYAVASTPLRTWTHTELTSALSLPPAVSDPVGLVMFAPPTGEGSLGSAAPYVDQKHVFFVSDDGKIQHCSANWAGPWTRNTDLMTLTGAPSPAVGQISAYAFNPISQTEDTLHVIYRDQANHIIELVWNAYQDSVTWKWNDLTSNAGAGPSMSDPFGYVCQVEGTQNVVYQGQDRKIQALLWGETSHGLAWSYDTGVSQVADMPTADGDPAVYSWESQGSKHIVFAGPDRNVYELYVSVL
jgi:hypothetical protein